MPFKNDFDGEGRGGGGGVPSKSLGCAVSSAATGPCQHQTKHQHLQITSARCQKLCDCLILAGCRAAGLVASASCSDPSTGAQSGCRTAQCSGE